MNQRVAKALRVAPQIQISEGLLTSDTVTTKQCLLMLRYCYIIAFSFIFSRDEHNDILAVADWGQRLSFYQLSGKQVSYFLTGKCVFVCVYVCLSVCIYILPKYCGFFLIFLKLAVYSTKSKAHLFAFLQKSMHMFVYICTYIN